MFSIEIVVSSSIYWCLDLIEVRFITLVVLLFIDLVSISEYNFWLSLYDLLNEVISELIVSSLYSIFVVILVK